MSTTQANYVKCAMCPRTMPAGTLQTVCIECQPKVDAMHEQASQDAKISQRQVEHVGATRKSKRDE